MPSFVIFIYFALIDMNKKANHLHWVVKIVFMFIAALKTPRVKTSQVEH